MAFWPLGLLLSTDLLELYFSAISQDSPHPKSKAAYLKSAGGLPARLPILSTHILPPIISANRLLIAKPNPVPPYCRLVEESTWLKDLNSRSMRSLGMPIPVSLTANCISYVWLIASGSPSIAGGSLALAAGTEIFFAVTETTTSPASVNFTALQFKDGSEGIQQDFFVSAFSQSSALGEILCFHE